MSNFYLLGDNISTVRHVRPSVGYTLQTAMAVKKVVKLSWQSHVMTVKLSGQSKQSNRAEANRIFGARFVLVIPCLNKYKLYEQGEQMKYATRLNSLFCLELRMEIKICSSVCKMKAAIC